MPYKVVTPSGRRYLNEDFRNKREAEVAIGQMMKGAAMDFHPDVRAIRNYAKAKIRKV
jgi:hypothetical protein